MKNKSITSRDVDFAQWYTDVIMQAKLADYSSTKGCIVFEPNGYAIWEKIQSVLDSEFKKLGHFNVSMPMLIPESLLKKEGDLIEGFAPEGAWVTIGGNKQLTEKLMVRPTSETLFSDYFAKRAKSYKDLPIKLNQWCSVMRWEKETRPFLRTREFLWQEGHTVHATAKEAEEEVWTMLNVYKKLFEEYLAIPVIVGKKTEKEKFAGAEYTLTLEALMYNGIALQSATSHYFGQKFAKAYGIQFLNDKNTLEYAYQTSWGSTTRMLGALIMVHSDDNGLVLPPKIAPRHVVIVPIGTDERVINVANSLCEQLNENNIISFIDNSDKTPGFKFAEHEVNGIPVRIEIGMKDLEKNSITLARRDTREKEQIPLDDMTVAHVKVLLDDIQNNLYNSALARNKNKTYTAQTIEDVKRIMNTQPGFIKADWCGDVACELAMKEIKGTKSRCIINDNFISGKCVVCGKPAKHLVVWGIQY